MRIFGISIDNYPRKETLGRIDRFLDEGKFHRIVTVNPEFLVEADRNPAFRDSLLSADLRIADGFGIVLAEWGRGKRIGRFPGADMMTDILGRAERGRHGVFLAVRKDGLSSYEEIRRSLLKRYPKLIVDGGEFDHRITDPPILHTPYSILLCNFGAPYQELFLDAFRSNPGDIRLAMGVGGAFDYLTGKRKRAPRWMRAMGLEWLWRLLLQPGRFVRIWNATAVFLWKVCAEKRKDPRS